MRGRGNIFWIAIAWLFVSLLSGFTAEARQGHWGESQRRGEVEIFLDLDGRTLSGHQSSLSIRREIQRQSPRFDLSQYELKEVYLQAEATGRRAVEVELVVNGQVQDSAYVQRRPGRGRMDELHLQSETRHSRSGAWALDFFGGEVKLYGLWVVLTPSRGGARPTPRAHQAEASPLAA